MEDKTFEEGQIVAIYGKVEQDIGTDVLVRLFSKTDEYTAWVRKDLVGSDSDFWNKLNEEEARQKAVEEFSELIENLDAVSIDHWIKAIRRVNSYRADAGT